MFFTARRRPAATSVPAQLSKGRVLTAAPGAPATALALALLFSPHRRCVASPNPVLHGLLLHAIHDALARVLNAMHSDSCVCADLVREGYCAR